MAKEQEPTPIKEVIERLMKIYRKKSSFNNANMKLAWQQVMGDYISKKTSQVYTNKQKLYVQLDSAPLKQELFMSKAEILNNLNQHTGERLQEIIFL